MKTEIQRQSGEWNYVHYRTQLVLGLPAALPLKIYKFISSNQQLQQAKHFYPNKTVVDGHINQSAFDQTTQRKISQKQFKMSNLIVQTGQLSVKIDNNHNKKLTLWLLKAIVGDSYCIQAPTNGEVFSKIPQNYDSIYICQNNNDEVYKHNYILREANQYVLEYQVLYIPERSRQYNVRQIICNKCQKRSASIYCKNQQVFFCSECNLNHHKDKLLVAHVRQQLTRFNTIGLCKKSEHNKKLQIFCMNCQTLLCAQCTINGQHSNREYQNHQTKSLKKYYQQKICQNQNLSKRKRVQLQDSLLKIQKLMDEVDIHALSLKRKITDIYQSLLKDLQDNTKYKLQKLLVVKTELKRQLDQLIWTDSFIKYQQQLLKPVFYFDAQKQYQIFRQNLMKTEIRQIPKIDPNDIDITGELKLIEIKQRNNYSTRFSQQKRFRLNSHSKQKKSSLSNSKYSAVKPSLNKMLNSKKTEDIQQTFKSNHLQIPKDKSISHFSRISNQQETNSQKKHILETSLLNAGLTSIKFS